MFNNLEEALNALPLQPSERYLAEVRARKKPRGPLRCFIRPHRGRGAMILSRSLLKSARKAMAMAYWEAQAMPQLGFMKRPVNPRQVAASVLEAFMEPTATELAPGISVTIPARFAYRTHAEYSAALAHYRYIFRPRLLELKPMPGAPGQ